DVPSLPASAVRGAGPHSGLVVDADRARACPAHAADLPDHRSGSIRENRIQGPSTLQPSFPQMARNNPRTAPSLAETRQLKGRQDRSERTASPSFTAVTQWDIDLFGSTLPERTHDVYWEEHQDNLEDLGVYYGEARSWELRPMLGAASSPKTKSCHTTALMRTSNSPYHPPARSSVTLKLPWIMKKKS